MRTTTHLHWALGIALAGLTSLMVPGCYINVDEGGSDWDGWDDTCDWGCDSSSIEDRAQEVCEPYCLKLITCDALSDGSYNACMELCVDRYIEDEDTVKDGCSCVSDGMCGSSAIEECEGQPIPDVWDDGDGSMGAGGSSGGDGTGGSDSGTGGNSSQEPDGPSCETNHDCALGADCVDNVCLDRCAASCQCGDGQACEEGYCQTPEEPAIACETVCDCTSGMDCVDGYCVD